MALRAASASSCAAGNLNSGARRYPTERTRQAASAANAEQSVAFLQQALHVQLFSADVYYVTRIPSLVRTADVVAIALAAFLLTLLATIYPALRAARTEPAEALRYE